ncbi:MAG: hypothetical protein IKD36_02895 [Clostridia bacterium]|nr:hypothetical protein [Clostridia bacterium]
MKQNMLVLSYDYEKSKQLAERLADAFSMRVLDSVDLFEFDHIPFTFKEILEKNGIEYVMKKMKSIIKMELDFDDTVFVSNINMADNCFDLFYKVKLSNFVILLKKNLNDEIFELKKKVYKTDAEREFFASSMADLKTREDLIESDLADTVVEIDGLSDDEILEKIIDKIKNYYSVN